jgi:hypothetical protein
MGEMGGPVDRAFLVSVDDLRDICDALKEGKREYKLTYDLENQLERKPGRNLDDSWVGGGHNLSERSARDIRVRVRALGVVKKSKIIPQ